MDCYVERSGIRTIIYDSFDRADGALGNAETGQTWLTNGSATTAWTILSNKARRASATYSKTSVAYIDAGKPNVTLSADLILDSGNMGSYLIARMSGTSVDNSMSLYVDLDYRIRIIKIIAGVNTILAQTTSYVISPGTSYACTFSCIGDRFTASLDGVEVLAVTDDNALKSNTIVGMFLPIATDFPTNANFFDNFIARG